MRGARNLRLIALAGFLVAVLLLGLLTLFNRQVMVAQIRDLGEKNHQLLARQLGNALWNELAPLIDERPAQAASLLSRPEIVRLSGQLQPFIAELSVIDFTIHNRHGITIFSIHRPKVGEDHAADANVRASLAGQQESRIHEESGSLHMNPDGPATRTVLESRLPMLHGPDRQIVGVMEIQQDISPLMGQVERAQWKQLLITALLVGGLSVLFALVVRRLRSDIRVHEEDRHTFIEQIQLDKKELESRIQERTRELTRINQALQIEVEVRRQTDVELGLAASVYQNTTEGIVVTDAQGLIESVNPAFTTITGYAEEDAIHKPMLMLFSSQHDEAFYRQLDQELTTHGRWRGEVWSQRRDGSVYPEFANINAIRDGDGVVRQYVKVFSDLSGIKRSEQQLHFLVHHDALTGLPNRLLLKDR
ncbi:MAG: PAS domain S-box protein, partial [Magnetococcales bacterium]|nr:PAS domain S-box protein [Magnetococcales bacterium]